MSEELNNLLQAAEAQQQKEKKKHRKGLWIFISLFLVLLLVAGGAIAALVIGVNNIDKAERLDSSEVFPAEETRPEAQEGVQNILLLGSDTRGEVGTDINEIRGQRSDTIMLMHVPADRSSVEVISFMRDYWVEIPGHGPNKINAALSYGGVPLLVQTIEQLTGVRIDHVSIVDFEGFKSLTTALGGVTVDNPQAFSEAGTDFAAGPITLEGEDALKFVRARYAFADGDYTRVENQQLFLKGVLQKVFSRETLTNPQQMMSMVQEFSPYLTVDDGMTAAYLAQLGFSVRDLRTDNFRFMTAPTQGTGMVGDQSVVFPDTNGLSILAQHLQADNMAAYVPTGQ